MISPLRVFYSPRVAASELAMDLARRFAERIVGHEERHLVPMMKVIEIHGHAPGT
jgi:hypothetical protein